MTAPEPRTAVVSLDRETSHGRDIRAALVGRCAVWTSLWDGIRRQGTIEAPTRWSDGYPIVRFDNGQWARLDNLVEVVNR